MAQAGTRQDRAERTRSRILETAAAAFAEHGYEGISLNDIVKLSGVSKGAFYFHFPSKEELALATFEAKQRELIARLAAPEPGSSRDGPAGAGPPSGDGPSGDGRSGDRAPDRASQRLAAMLVRRNRLLRDDPSLACVTRLGNELNVRTAPGSGFASFHETPLRLIAGVVRDGQTAGEFRDDLDADAVAEAIFAWVVGIDTLSAVASGTRDLEERSGVLLALLIPALRRPGTDPTRR